MYELLNQSIPDVNGYLDRLGVKGPVVPDLGNLNLLIYRHQTRVPFEDLNSSLLGLPVSLEIPALYEKVVARRRGGYCFELNALFARLLNDLGYHARQVFCRVVRGRDFLPPCAHEAVIVTLDGQDYFCDVGYGGPSPAGALPVADGAWTTVMGESFQIRRYDDWWWTLARAASDGNVEDILQFNTFPQTPQEFLALNQKWSTDPEALFVRQVIVNLRTDDGSLALSRDALTVRRSGQTETIPVNDDDHFRQILKEYFGII